MATLAKGSTIGPFPYTIEKRLGERQGNMSEVYLAKVEHPQSTGQVVLKIARVVGSHGEFHEAGLRNEVEHLRRVNHPGIIHIYPIILTRDGPPNLPYSARATSLDKEPWFSVLEYLPGGSLSDLLSNRRRIKRGGGLDLGLVLEVARNLSCTLDYLHSRNVVHMDIKPQNILFRSQLQESAIVEPVLVDFGISRQTNQEGMEAGTRDYAPPERLRGVHQGTEPPEAIKRPHPSMDIYSLGIVIYQMITGRLPYQSRSGKSVTDSILEGQPTNLSQHYQDSETKSIVASVLDPLVMQMLSRDPNARPSAENLTNSLEQASFRLGYQHRQLHAVQNPVVSPILFAASKPQHRQKFPLQWWTSFAAITLFALLLGGLGGLGLARYTGSISLLGALAGAVPAFVQSPTTPETEGGSITSNAVTPEEQATTPPANAPTDMVAPPTVTRSDSPDTPTVQVAQGVTDTVTATVIAAVAATQTATLTAPTAITVTPKISGTPAITMTATITPTSTNTPAPLSVTLLRPNPGERVVGTYTFQWESNNPIAWYNDSWSYLILVCQKEPGAASPRFGICLSEDDLGPEFGFSINESTKETAQEENASAVIAGVLSEFKTGQEFYWAVFREHDMKRLSPVQTFIAD